MPEFHCCSKFHFILGINHKICKTQMGLTGYKLLPESLVLRCKPLRKKTRTHIHARTHARTHTRTHACIRAHTEIIELSLNGPCCLSYIFGLMPGQPSCPWYDINKHLYHIYLGQVQGTLRVTSAQWNAYLTPCLYVTAPMVIKHIELEGNVLWAIMEPRLRYEGHYADPRLVHGFMVLTISVPPKL